MRIALLVESSSSSPRCCCSVPGTDNEGRFLEAAPDNGSLGAPILIGEASAHRSNSHLSNTHRYQLHQMKVLAPR